MDTSSIDLPDEIIELILSRCLVKSVGRFKSVSKSWRSIISNPRFSRLHLIQRSKLPENRNKFILWALTLKDHWHHCLYLMRVEDGKFRRESELGMNPFGKVFPICSCDGLILLFHTHNADYMLWNPLIRKHIIIPAFNPDTHPQAFGNWPLTYTHARHNHLYHNSITDDYKIVFLYQKCYTVYSCKNGSWGEIKDFPCDWDLYEIVVDGCFYSMCYPSIICFDARDGKMHKFPQPKELECLVGVQLMTVSERLCLYGFLDNDKTSLHLWVMEENGSFDKSWRKLISMDKSLNPYTCSLIPQCLSSEDDVVFWSVADGKLKHFIYNGRKNCRFQENSDFIWDGNIFEYFPYSENLYMPF